MTDLLLKGTGLKRGIANITDRIIAEQNIADRRIDKRRYDK